MRNQFINIVKKYFAFLKKDFHYKENRVGSSVIEYFDKELFISISYDNRDDILDTTLYKLKKGMFSKKYYFKNEVPLKKLNQTILTKLNNQDFIMNDKYFSEFKPTNDFEKKMLKLAKDLRLCLLNYDLYKNNI